MNQFKFLSLTCVCLLLISSSGFSEEVKGESAAVVEQVSEEAAVLRALVEEYKAKAAGKLKGTASEAVSTAPDSKTNLIDPAANENVEAARAAVLDQMVSQIMPPKGTVVTLAENSEVPKVTTNEAQTPAIPPVETITSVSTLISNPIEPVDSVISSAQANMAAKVEAPIESITSVVVNDAAPEAPNVTEVEKPTAAKPMAAAGSIILRDDALATGSESLEAAAAAAAAAALEPSDAPVLVDAPAKVEMTAVVPNPSTEAPAVVPAVPAIPAAPEKPAAPAAANSVEMAVAETLKELEAGKSAAKEKVEALEGSAMKAAEKPVAAVENGLDEKPKVAAADEMKKTVDATRPRSTVKTSTKSGSEKPLATAKKKTTPAANAGTANAATQATVVPSAGETPASAATPPANGASDTPKTNAFKGLGKLLFGSKEGAANSNPRAPIFKRKAQPQPAAQPATPAPTPATAAVAR